MKKYTHPKKNTTIVISQNGATNFGYIFTNNKFSNTSFDFRNFVENDYSNVETNTFITFINEYKYATQNMWFKLENKNDNNKTTN